MTDEQVSATVLDRDSGSGAAFFDLDRTLIRGSANFPLAIAAFRAGYVSPKDLARDAYQAITFVLKGASDARSEKLRERILRAVAGQPVEKIRALGESFVPKLAASVMPEAQAELDRAAALGEDRVIVSASPVEIVEALAGSLGLEGAVGTRSEIIDGCYSGKLAGPFCYANAKPIEVARLAKERGYDLAKSTAYSDSVSDLPFLEGVGTAVALNPDKELRVIARQRGWRIIEVKPPAGRFGSFISRIRHLCRDPSGKSTKSGAVTPV